MVDRGGLNYPIRVRDEFSKTTALFRKELRASKKEFRDFQKVVSGQKSAAKGIREQAKATKELAAAQRQLAAATKSAVKPMSDEEKAARATEAANRKLAKSIALAAAEQKKRERIAIALRNAQTADARREKARVAALEREARAAKKLADSKNAELVASKKLQAELFKEKVVRAEIELLRQRAGRLLRQGQIAEGTAALKRSRELEKSLKGQVNSAQKLLFTFRRLVGALAIFTLARRGVQAFQDLVKSGIQFNDTVATAQLGIAGLVVTLGDVRDSMGNSVSATEQLNLALGIAREQTALLRQDSLKTVATFEQLLDTFQVSVGPGLAAGLDLDEVRKLTVDISQAASALGVPQNQLAEEVRSLLSGTIQARTTRIATALGISNEDVRRLKETGELFDVLEEKFQGFGEAAERQARTTFSGITTLLRGLFQEVLGQAAAPLFQQLIDLGNDLFDNVLSIRDAAGNIRPSPEAVAAFQQIFDALKRAGQAAAELGGGSALGLIETISGGIAVTIDAITGAVVGLVNVFTVVGDLIKGIAEQLNLTREGTGNLVSDTTKWAVQLLVGFKIVNSMVPLVKFIARGISGWAIAIVAVVKGFEIIFEKITGVNLTLGDTIELIAVSLYGAWLDIANVVSIVAVNIVTFMENAIDAVITAAKNKASEAKGFLAALFGSDEGAQAAAKERLDRELESTNRIAKRKREAALEIADIEAQGAAKKKAIEEEINKIVDDRAKANGGGFDPTLPGDLGGPGAAGDVPDFSGAAPGGQVFGRARIDDNLLKKANDLTIQLQAQAEAERAKTDAIIAGLGPNEMALVAAENAVALAQAELETVQQKNAAELAPFLQQREGLAEGAELDNLNEFISALQVRQGYEEEILRLRREQLQAAQAEAELVANGSLTEGLQAGFQQFAEQFSSTYNAGLEIAKQGTAALAAFASQAIVDAFDPTKEVDLKERFARLMQSIAQTILQQLIQLAIAKAILGFKDGGVVPELNAGGVPLSFAKGGEVPHMSRKAQGLARGGLPRPGHIPASDTVPAWLTPGEFVMNKAATSQFLPLLEGMNGGSMSVVGSSSAEAAGPSTGMASGGLVADRIANAGGSPDEGGSSTVVVPAIVARDGEMDKLTAGGRNAMLAFMRENAGNINSLLDRSNGRG